MDAYSYVLLACLGVLSIVFTVVVVLRLKFPPLPPMEADQEHRDLVARRCRDLNQTK